MKGRELTNTLDTTPWERQARQLLERYGTDDIDEALRRENEEQSVHSLADGIVGRALCRDPECRKTFEIPESSKEKPRLCPECRAKEGGIQVSEETTRRTPSQIHPCTTPGCGNPRATLTGKLCAECLSKARVAGRAKGGATKKAGEKLGKKTPSIDEVEKGRIEAQYDATHPPAKEPKVQEMGTIKMQIDLKAGDIKSIARLVNTLPEATDGEIEAAIHGYLWAKGSQTHTESTT